MLFLFEASGENNYFDYEDLLGRTEVTFDKIVGNYFSLLIKTLPIDNFFSEYLIFIRAIEGYGFESINKTILSEYDEEAFIKLEALLIDKVRADFKKDEYWKYDLIYLLLGIYKRLKSKEKYIDTCKSFNYLSEEFGDMIDEYDKEE